MVITRQLFDWGTPPGLRGFYRFQPNQPTNPHTPDMEIYKAFGNFSGGIRLPGSGWSGKPNASGVQVEGVCVGTWAKPRCLKKPCAPPMCDHIKVALISGGVGASLALRIRLCNAAGGSGTAVVLDGTKPGVQHSVVACGNESHAISLKADTLMVIECRCSNGDWL